MHKKEKNDDKPYLEELDILDGGLGNPSWRLQKKI